MTTLKNMMIDADGKPRTVTFTHYRAGLLWYTTETGFAFPVPIEDTGEATFLAQDKATLFMRYIRKHIAQMAEAA